MTKHHEISNILIENGLLSLEIDGKSFKSPLSKISNILANANETTLNIFEISPSGYGIHWPLLDEDISIDGLLGIKHSAPNIQQSA